MHFSRGTPTCPYWPYSLFSSLLSCIWIKVVTQKESFMLSFFHNVIGFIYYLFIISYVCYMYMCLYVAYVCVCKFAQVCIAAYRDKRRIFGVLIYNFSLLKRFSSRSGQASSNPNWSSWLSPWYYRCAHPCTDCYMDSGILKTSSSYLLSDSFYPLRHLSNIIITIKNHGDCYFFLLTWAKFFQPSFPSKPKF